MPNGIAIRVPTARPSRIDTRRIAAGANRSMPMMTARVRNPKAMFFGSPKSGPAAVPPPNQPAATRIRDTPMMRMIVPVTSGGKKRISLPTIGATAIMNNPHAMTDP